MRTAIALAGTHTRTAAADYAKRWRDTPGVAEFLERVVMSSHTTENSDGLVAPPNRCPVPGITGVCPLSPLRRVDRDYAGSGWRCGAAVCGGLRGLLPAVECARSLPRRRHCRGECGGTRGVTSPDAPNASPERRGSVGSRRAAYSLHTATAGRSHPVLHINHAERPARPPFAPPALPPDRVGDPGPGSPRLAGAPSRPGPAVPAARPARATGRSVRSRATRR